MERTDFVWRFPLHFPLPRVGSGRQTEEAKRLRGRTEAEMKQKRKQCLCGGGTRSSGVAIVAVYYQFVYYFLYCRWHSVRRCAHTTCHSVCCIIYFFPAESHRFFVSILCSICCFWHRAAANASRDFFAHVHPYTASAKRPARLIYLLCVVDTFHLVCI